MRYLKIIVAIFVIAFFLGMYYFVSNNWGVDMTGRVTDESLVDIDILKMNVSKYEAIINASREQAMSSLIEGEEIIVEMIEKELPFVFMTDKLLEADRAFKQAEYAAILRGEVVVSEDEKLEAGGALRLLDWEDITYDDVIVNINEMKEWRDKIFIIHDSLVATKISLMKEGGLDTSILGMVSLTEGMNESDMEVVSISDSIEDVDLETKRLFDEATIALYEERGDAEDLLVELGEHLESKRRESATANILKNNLANFIKRNWIMILIFLVVLGGMIYVIYRNFVYRGLREEIGKMELEKKVILQLIKKIQNERFKEKKISEFVYKIRLKKYSKRLAVINTKIPVLESKLQGEVA